MRLLLLLPFYTFSTIAFCQTVNFEERILDLNQNSGSNVTHIVNTGGSLFFYDFAQSGLNSTDGTIPGTRQALNPFPLFYLLGSTDGTLLVSDFQNTRRAILINDSSSISQPIVTLSEFVLHRASNAVGRDTVFYLSVLESDPSTITRKNNFLVINGTSGAIDTFATSERINLSFSVPSNPAIQRDSLFMQWPVGESSYDIWILDFNTEDFRRTGLMTDSGFDYLEGDIFPSNDKLYSVGVRSDNSRAIVSFSLEGNAPKVIAELSRFEFIESLVVMNGNTFLMTNGVLYSIDQLGNIQTVFSNVDDLSLSSLTRVGNKLLFMKNSEYFISDGSIFGTRSMNIVNPSVTGENNFIAIVDGIAFISGSSPPFDVEYHNYLYDSRNDALISIGSSKNVGSRISCAWEGQFVFNGYTENEGTELHFLSPSNLLQIKGRVYHDKNGNGEEDAEEAGVSNIKILASGEGSFNSFSQNGGDFSLLLPSRGMFTIAPEFEECWELTSQPREYTVNVSTVGNEGLKFGLKPIPGPSASKLHVSTGPLRCGFTVPVWLTINNTGCGDLSGSVNLGINQDIVFVSASLPPSTINTDEIRWNIQDVSPGSTVRLLCYLQMPSEEFNGDEISLPLSAMLIDENGAQVSSDTFAFSSILSCAIDPNDKQAFPQRIDPSESFYTLNAETIDYTIRFQNTGTDTAFTVRLMDQLDTNLDLTTLRLISSSHSHKTSLSPSGELEIIFDEIMLPDSSTNQLLSNGYFAYSISPKEDVEDFTPVRNTADIVFDYNAPIITNTTLNTLVETLDADNDTFFFWEDCDDEDPTAYPGALDPWGNEIDENCDGVDGVLATNNPQIAPLDVFPNPTSGEIMVVSPFLGQGGIVVFDAQGRPMAKSELWQETSLNISHLPKGLYLVIVTDRNTGSVAAARIIRQ